MQHSLKGEFYGQTNKTINLKGITVTDTVYTHDKVDWHYHENAYFTYILQGNVIEGNKKEVYNCSTGDLLFHNWQDPHYNVKPPGFTRGFHIELEKTWIDEIGINTNNIQGSLAIKEVIIKLLIHKIFKETIIDDITSELSIQSLVLNTLTCMVHDSNKKQTKIPDWAYKIRELINEQYNEKLTLEYLSNALNIHPVHLSRDFSKYFNSGLGEYIRKLKVQKSLQLISENKMTLTEIAYATGFSDQSHLIRCFKNINGICPATYRKLFFRKN